MTLNRRDQILKYIVEHFVKTAQPVGSKTLIEIYHLPFSSATIRSEMFALEQLGYLEKTHTSSGRVPSSEGYRFYCQYLRDKSLNEDFKGMLVDLLKEKSKSIEEVVKSSCEILSHMTSLASVVLGPNVKNECLVSIQCIPLSSSSASIIFVTDKGYVENKTFVFDEKTSIKDLTECMKMFSDRLVGTPIYQLVDKMVSLKPILSDYIISHDAMYKAIMETFIRFVKDRIELYGKNELFEQPEYSGDAKKIKELLNFLESPENVKKYQESSSSDYKKGNIHLHIGNENEGPDVSIITTKLSFGEANEGTIALVGPKRMDYDKVLSALELLDELLKEYFR
jgi:heat-inducible transcriptional repressor